MMNNWNKVTIEQLRPFDVVIHASDAWVIQNIRRQDGYQYFNATRIDDGHRTKWTFHPHSFGYLMERLERP